MRGRRLWVLGLLSAIVVTVLVVGWHLDRPAAVAASSCRLSTRFDRLDSVRTAPSATAGQLVFGVPPHVAVRDAARISRLAHAVCALPRAPSGHAAIACPADYGVAYHLRFEAAHAPSVTIVLDTSGCEFVSGLTPERWVRSSRFWSTLAWVLGANPPVAAAVTGH